MLTENLRDRIGDIRTHLLMRHSTLGASILAQYTRGMKE